MKRKFLTLAVMIACATNLVACSKTENESTGSNSTETTTSSQNDSSNSTKSDISEVDPNKENYTKPDYDAWNHDQLENNTKVKVSGKIIQAMYENGDGTFRIAMENDYDKVILAYIEKDLYTDTVAEGDEVTFYGYSYGRHTYQSTLGSSITIPLMNIVMYEDYHSDDYVSKEIYNQSGILLEQTNFDSFKLTNNSGQKITVTVDSMDVNGQVIDNYSFNGFSYEDLNTGQWKTANLRNDSGLMMAGASVNITLKIIDDSYNTIAIIPLSLKLEKDVLK